MAKKQKYDEYGVPILNAQDSGEFDEYGVPIKKKEPTTTDSTASGQGSNAPQPPSSPSGEVVSGIKQNIKTGFQPKVDITEKKTVTYDFPKFAKTDIKQKSDAITAPKFANPVEQKEKTAVAKDIKLEKYGQSVTAKEDVFRAPTPGEANQTAETAARDYITYISVDDPNKGYNLLSKYNELKSKEKKDRSAEDERFLRDLESEALNLKYQYKERDINRISSRIEELESMPQTEDVRRELSDLYGAYGKTRETLEGISRTYDLNPTNYGKVAGREATEQEEKTARFEALTGEDVPTMTYLKEVGKGALSAFGGGAMNILEVPKIMGDLVGDTDYDWFDELADFTEEVKSGNEAGLGAPLPEGKTMKDLPAAARVAVVGGNALGSVGLFAAGGALTKGEMAQKVATFGTAFLTSEADYYQEALSSGMNPQEAAAASTALAGATALAESIIPDIKYLETSGFRKSVIREFKDAVTSGLPAKQAAKLAFKNAAKALPESVGSRVLTGVKEGGEEAVGQVSEDVTKEAINAVGAEEYFKDTFNPDDYVDGILGGFVAGGGLSLFQRPSHSPLEKKVMREIVENRGAVTDVVDKRNEATVDTSILEEAGTDLDALKSHSGWENLSEDQKDDAFAATQSIRALEKEQEALSGIRLEDAAKEEKIKALEEEVNKIFEEGLKNKVESKQNVSETPFTESVEKETFYHGTPVGYIEEFDESKIGSTTDEGGIGDYGKGFYFGTSEEGAKTYATGDNGNVVSVKLDMKKPLDLRKVDAFKQELSKQMKERKISALSNDFDSLFSQVAESMGMSVEEAEYMEEIADRMNDNWQGDEFQNEIKKKGYDSVISPNGERVVFDKSQISIVSQTAKPKSEKTSVKETAPELTEEEADNAAALVQDGVSVEDAVSHVKEVAKEENPALRDVESTANAIKNILDNTPEKTHGRLQQVGSEKTFMEVQGQRFEFDEPIEKFVRGLPNVIYRGLGGDQKKGKKRTGFYTQLRHEAFRYADSRDENVLSVIIKPTAKILNIVDGDWENYTENEDAISEYEKLTGEKYPLEGVTESLWGDTKEKRALRKAGYDVVVAQSIDGHVIVVLNESAVEDATPENISKSYHNAKADGSNPELVKAVEELLGKEQPTTEKAVQETPTVQETGTEEKREQVRDEKVNSLLDLKKKYNSLPKKERQTRGANIFKQIQDQAKELGFDVTPRQNGKIGITQNGRKVAKRGVSRELDPEGRRQMEKKALSWAQSGVDPYAAILAYFAGGGAVKSGQSELGQGTEEMANAKRKGLVKESAESIDNIANYDLADMGIYVADEQEATNMIQEVLSSFGSRAEMMDELIDSYERYRKAEEGYYEGMEEEAVEDMGEATINALAKDFEEYWQTLTDEQKSQLNEEYEQSEAAIQQGMDGEEGTRTRSSEEKEFDEKRQEVEQRLADAVKKRNDKIVEINKKATLFPENKRTDELLDVPVDQSEENLKRVMKPYEDAVSKIKEELKQLDESKSDFIKAAKERNARQQKITEEKPSQKFTKYAKESTIFAELLDTRGSAAKDKILDKFGDIKTKAEDVYNNFDDYLEKLEKKAAEKGIEFKTTCKL